LNIVPRHLARHINQSLKVDRVVALMGPRQSGKTTLVRHLLKSSREIKYYNLKDPDTRRLLQKNAAREFDHFHQCLIVLDEVQRIPELVERIQVQVDSKPDEKGQFMLLGSNHLLLNRRIRESLAGRVVLFRLYPFSLSELAGRSSPALLSRLLRERSIPAVEESLSSAYIPVEDSIGLSARFDELNLFGGYPEFLARKDDDARKQWLDSYHQTYLDTDLRELVNLRNPDSFERFEQLFVSRIGSLFKLSELARDCAVSVNTIQRFTSYYRQLFVAWACRPFHSNLGKRVMKMPKWYFVDTGLLRSLLKNFRPEDGTLFENTVLSEIRKLLYQEALNEDVCFFRTSTGVESDAVISGRDGEVVFFCEVMQKAGAHRTDVRHLKKLVALSGEHIGLLINTADSVEKLDERIWQVPVHLLLG